MNTWQSQGRTYDLEKVSTPKDSDSLFRPSATLDWLLEIDKLLLSPFECSLYPPGVIAPPHPLPERFPDIGPVWLFTACTHWHAKYGCLAE